MSGVVTSGLLERDAELTALDALAARAAGREGGIALLEGPAGIGKTALLRAARETARARGLTVLSATGSELDREFPFGLVHQLLDPALALAGPERRARVLTGAAALAEPVLLAGEAPVARGADPAHAVLHGLYWTVANLAEEEPLALVVDDLHWGDRASLRFLEFLGRRLEGLPVLVVGAARADEPGAERDLLAALAAGPAAQVLAPAPLSEPGVAALLGEALGADPDGGFALACAGATGGNPLLLAELAREAAGRGLRGEAAEAPDVERIGAAGVAGHVRRRLAALGSGAADVAAATAVLGERARPDDVAAICGLAETEAAAAGDLLARAGILATDARSFVHPLVREAVIAELPPSRRSAMHAVAARRLAARGARADEVALHLLPTAPAGDPWVVDALRAAARAAAAEGSPEIGVTHLRRALAEPPPPRARPEVLLELGTLESAAGEDGALEHLTDALEGGLPGELRPAARTVRGRLLLYRDVPAAFDELAAALAEATDPGDAVRLEAMMLDATMYDLAVYDRRPALLEREGAPSAARLAHLAIDAGYAPRHRDEVEALARRALQAGEQLAVLGPESSAVHLLVQAVRNVELPVLAAEVADRIELGGRREGSRFALFMAAHCRAFWQWWFGSLASAEAHARAGVEIAEQAGLGNGRLAMAAVLAEILRERGNLDEAERLVEGFDFTDALEGSVTGADFLSARGVIRWMRGRREDAEADLRRSRELLHARGWRNPLKGRASLRLAELLAEQGRSEEALAIAREDAATAERAGMNGARGMALRVAARASSAAEGERLLREAVASLGDSPMHLERAWALHDLGALLRREGRRTDARETLRLALDVAERHGGGELSALVREELGQAGARPRRSAVTGPESLTPSERRVAELAASGLSNREIAETLWVSRKTVEVHLGHAYGKLGIRSRSELPAALG